MAKNLIIYSLLELYSPLLTEKQRKMLEYYYFDDLSLSEISENEGGSRQAALDIIKRAEKELQRMEDALGLYGKSKEKEKLVNLIKTAADEGDCEKVKSLIKDL